MINTDDGKASASAFNETDPEKFLYREANLLDDCRFGEWFELFDVEARYEIQARILTNTGVRQRGPKVAGRQMLCDDDQEFLGLRVRRLVDDLANCEMPASITRRLITNVVVDPIDDRTLAVRSNFAIYQGRRDQHMLVGAREDVLESSHSGLRILRRRAVLDCTVLPRTISVFL